ncbi:unnamed protein product, partial [Echinostoma caproni]|uniref:START domain-containing protein n=1 Tax=Echinostoma caproni TaxID=27848 RepID=A0A182ZZF9_9TREM
MDAVEQDENDTHIGAQLFEDEDTRLFYESLPDIKAMVPGILYKDSEQAKPDTNREKTEEENSTVEDIDVETVESELAREEEEVFRNTEDSATANAAADRDKPPTMLGIEETEEDPNSSGKVLMETFLTQLPNCVNRDLIDRAAVDFCLNLNKRSNRRRLARALLMVPRTRYDLLPFYARLVAALAPVMPDLVQDVNTMLTGEFRWRVSKRDQLNLESKLKVVRFIAQTETETRVSSSGFSLMDEIPVRRELTKTVRLNSEVDVFPGCMLKIFEFDDSTPMYLKEIYFSNYYTGRVSAKLCIEDVGSYMPIWIDLFRIQLMPDYHYSAGSCANVKVTFPSGFKTVESPQRLQRAVFMLQQSSPIWKEYSINAV